MNKSFGTPRTASPLQKPTILSLNNAMFMSPPAAGRKITAGFSFLQRIGKSAAIDVWFPDMLKKELDQIIKDGARLGAQNFPAEWAAVRQFELLQESGNYKVYDMDVSHLTRCFMDLSRSMRAGGYRVTVATIGGYVKDQTGDELEILDKRLRDRISSLIHMLYLEDQSETINAASDAALAQGSWDYNNALPHIGVTLGAHDLFKPMHGGMKKVQESILVPPEPHEFTVADAIAWAHDISVKDIDNSQLFQCVEHAPHSGQYNAVKGHYRFAPEDAGRAITLTYARQTYSDDALKKLAVGTYKQKLAKHFFAILGLLPQNHIVHDTAVGLQLPESLAEEEWLYIAEGDETFHAFNVVLNDLFAPFNDISLSILHGREDATRETKPAAQHMRSYGDRLRPEFDQLYRNLAQFSLQ